MSIPPTLMQTRATVKPVKHRRGSIGEKIGEKHTNKKTKKGILLTMPRAPSETGPVCSSPPLLAFAFRRRLESAAAHNGSQRSIGGDKLEDNDTQDNRMPRFLSTLQGNDRSNVRSTL